MIQIQFLTVTNFLNTAQERSGVHVGLIVFTFYFIYLFILIKMAMLTFFEQGTKNKRNVFL